MTREELQAAIKAKYGDKPSWCRYTPEEQRANWERLHPAHPKPEWDVSQPSRGLGDTVAKVTHFLGIDKVANYLANKDAAKPCSGCAQRQASFNQAIPYKRPSAAKMPPIQKRHLAYHVYAKRDSMAWRANLRQLAKRWDVFTGARFIAVATDENTEPLAVVREYLESRLPADRKPEWFQQRNDPELREGVTFPGLLALVQCEIDSSDSLFYAHTKGVSPWGQPPGGHVGITWWRNAMYHHLLDDPEKVDELLTRFPCVGTTKIVWRDSPKIKGRIRHGLVDRGKGPSPYPSGLVHGAWMFSGTYWWVRTDELFSRDWKNIPRDHYGIEAYLSGIFDTREALSVYQPWPERSYPKFSSYHPDHHKEHIEDIPE